MAVETDKLGTLEKVAIRECWKDEARDFTPWLAKQIDLLGDAIGFELEVEEQESSVGSFRADIVCRSTDERRVIVESQFAKTDHDHLGKLLTYAAGKDAAVIVWVAEEFRDEHRAAIDWLNKNTADGIHCFGIQMELWKIGHSAPAPKFHVVSMPNDWTKATIHSEKMSDTQKLRLKFWTGLRDVMEQNKGNVKPTSPPTVPWMSFSIGRSAFYLSALLGIKRRNVAVQLSMDGPKAEAHYHLLLQEKDEVEKEIGQELEWRALPYKKQKQVNLWREEREDCDVRNEQQWDDFHLWLYEHLEKFYDVFSKRITKLNADDWQDPEAQDEDDD